MDNGRGGETNLQHPDPPRYLLIWKYAQVIYLVLGAVFFIFSMSLVTDVLLGVTVCSSAHISRYSIRCRHWKTQSNLGSSTNIPVSVPYVAGPGLNSCITVCGPRVLGLVTVLTVIITSGAHTQLSWKFVVHLVGCRNPLWCYWRELVFLGSPLLDHRHSTELNTRRSGLNILLLQITTVGYGDYAPTTQVGRMIV